MDNVAGKWALVTGASSGFGVQFAMLLAERKANLVLAARRIEPMEQLAKQLQQRHNVSVVVEGIDLSVSRAAVDLKARLDQRGIAVDILVNNAGYGLYGSFVEQPLPKIIEMLQLTRVYRRNVSRCRCSKLRGGFDSRRTAHGTMTRAAIVLIPSHRPCRCGVTCVKVPTRFSYALT